MAIFFTLLAAIGMTYIVTDSELLLPIRNFIIQRSNDNEDQGIWSFFADLIMCPQCMSFWSGVLIEFFKWVSPGVTTIVPFAPLSFFMVGCAASGCVTFLPKILRGE